MAGIKISALPAVLNALLTDFFPVVQGGVTSQETLQQVMTLFQSSMTNLTGLTGAIEAPTFIGDSLGNKNLAFTYIASAVNYITSLNSITTVFPSLVATGSDTNIGFGISAKGTGNILLRSPSSTTVLNLQPNSGSSNFLGSLIIPITANRSYTFPDASGTLAFTSSLFSWTDVTGTSQAMAVNSGYVADNAGLVTLTLPALSALGATISIQGKGAGGWLIAQNAGQNIQIGSSSSTVGVGGSVASTNRWNSLNLVCVTANTTWASLGASQSAGLTIV